MCTLGLTHISQKLLEKFLLTEACLDTVVRHENTLLKTLFPLSFQYSMITSGVLELAKPESALCPKSKLRTCTKQETPEVRQAGVLSFEPQVLSKGQDTGELCDNIHQANARRISQDGLCTIV